MKKLFILAIVVLGFATISFASHANANSKNQTGISVQKTTNSKITKTTIPGFATANVIAAVATRTQTVAKSASATKATTDNLIWLATTDNYSSYAHFQIYLNDNLIVDSDINPHDGLPDPEGTIPLSDGDVVTVRFWETGPNPAYPYSNREIWIEDPNTSPPTLLGNALENDPEVTTVLTYTHVADPNQNRDLYLYISNWAF